MHIILASGYFLVMKQSIRQGVISLFDVNSIVVFTVTVFTRNLSPPMITYSINVVQSVCLFFGTATIRMLPECCLWFRYSARVANYANGARRCNRQTLSQLTRSLDRLRGRCFQFHFFHPINNHPSNRRPSRRETRTLDQTTHPSMQVTTVVWTSACYNKLGGLHWLSTIWIRHIIVNLDSTKSFSKNLSPYG